ncbi:GTP cyclohydrolase FolE2 [Xanthomonas arboricola]|nr:GTP cyclohydrolase FolE2 [Xanthomonas sp. CFBP 8152]
MSATLADVAVTERSTLSAPLRWVGMQDIAVPVRLADARCADADALARRSTS